MSNIKDVAETAGVSAATVARVINHRPGVRQEKIDLVHAAMRKLGYVPPPAAARRGPRTRAREGVYTRNIAYLLINMSDHVINNITHPGLLSEILNQQGINLFYVQMPDPSRLPGIINSTRVDGVIYQGEEPRGKALEELKKLPTVRMMTRHEGEVAFDCVAPDNVAIGEMAAVYLKNSGIGLVSTIWGGIKYSAFRQRRDAFVRKARDLNLDIIELEAEESVINTEKLEWNQVHDLVVRQLLKCFERQKGRRLGIFYPWSTYNGLIYHLNAIRTPRDRDNTFFVFGDASSDDYCCWLNGKPPYIDARIDEINKHTVEQLLLRMRNGTSLPLENITVPPMLVTP